MKKYTLEQIKAMTPIEKMGTTDWEEVPKNEWVFVSDCDNCLREGFYARGVFHRFDKYCEYEFVINIGSEILEFRYCHLEDDELTYKYQKTIEIDWTKVPVDTPVLVWNISELPSKKTNSHFKSFKENKYYCFIEGRTSWTSAYVVSWDNCELAPHVEIKEEWLK